jgi:bifunctional enzyme CysN/CysC
MVTGAATADLAIVVVDATEGLLAQSRRHLYLLGLLGVRRLIVAVNKMDQVGYAAGRFASTSQQIRDYLKRIGLGAASIVPISARDGAMIGDRDARLDWYNGPTLLEALDGIEPDTMAPEILPLRFTVQDVYKFDERRILAGRVESGVLRVGDALAFAPGGAVARVKSIEDWNQPIQRTTATAGDSIGITLDDRIFVERGQVAAPASGPIPLARQLSLRVFWLAADPLTAGRAVTLKAPSGGYLAVVTAIEAVIDLETLDRRASLQVSTNAVADIRVDAIDPIPADRHAALPRTGRLVLTDGDDALGGAIVLDLVELRAADPLPPVSRNVTRTERERRHRHRGAVLWLTGLPGSGKSTLATGLERVLFDGGMHAIVLDGGSIRQGLSHDLGYTPADRGENTRRVAETARLLADAGNIVIAALGSPTRADRARARSIVGDGFAEIYVKADLAVCEARDPKGRYRAARRGENVGPTGAYAHYEPPEAPDITIDTGKLDIAESVDRLVGFVDGRFHDPRIDQRLIEPEWSV